MNTTYQLAVATLYHHESFRTLGAIAEDGELLRSLAGVTTVEIARWSDARSSSGLGIQPEDEDAWRFAEDGWLLPLPYASTCQELDEDEIERSRRTATFNPTKWDGGEVSGEVFWHSEGHVDPDAPLSAVTGRIVGYELQP